MLLLLYALSIAISVSCNCNFSEKRGIVAKHKGKEVKYNNSRAISLKQSRKTPTCNFSNKCALFISPFKYT